MVDLGTHLTYRGRLHVVVGVTPIGATPRLLELEDIESGRLRRVEWADPGLDTHPPETSWGPRRPKRRAGDRLRRSRAPRCGFGVVRSGIKEIEKMSHG
jgi:hypothetical protein